ncbi:MAG: amidohydrolase family protein [Deltaproteobacteria bacterium]|nr:amidohydrolase family protein [Deltaproteobacteria bacterium]
MRIDIHNHFYPTKFLKQLENVGSTVGITIETDDWGRQIIVQHGNRLVTITPPMNNVNKRIEDMDQSGFDMQILTLSAPSVDIFPVETGETLAKVVNDEIARICQEDPDHFMAFATLPFIDPNRTVKELERCIDALGFKGACMGTNINGMGLDDQILYPFYERMADYDLPIHIHPRAPADKETYKDYRLVPMIGFEMELCIAVVRLIMGGVMERFPNLKFIVSHLGGALPYLAERIQNCYEAYPECQENISRPAKDYLKRFYYDTVSFFEPALMCAYSFLGARRLILGSDYPHVIGDIREAVTSIEHLDIPQTDKEMIYSANILRLIHKDN